MARAFLLPRAPLARHVRHILAGTFDSDQVHLPACADVQLLLYQSGGAWLIDPSGAETRLPAAFIVGAVDHPRRYRVEGGSQFVALTFRPGGLYACLGIAASDLTGRIVPSAPAQAMLDDPSAHDDLVARVQAMLEQGLTRSSSPPMQLPLLDLDELNLPVRELARRNRISVRQFERRCLVRLGMPLRAYRRLARYSAAMAALMMQGASPQALAALAHDARYVDQAHLTRDFSAMAGQSPGRYLKNRTHAAYSVWQFTREELETYLG